MTNYEKDELRRLIRREIRAGRTVQEVKAKLKWFGCSVSTIERYYKTWREER